MTRRRAIFLDRDGVINANRPDHVKTWEEFVFLPRSLDALRRLASDDFLVVVTTNQAAIHRGLVDESTVHDIHVRMTAAVREFGGCIDAVFLCPHLPEEECGCRKPKPGMYLRAARELDIDLGRSYVVGDALADVTAAHAIGAQPILVLTGRGLENRPRLVESDHADCPVVDDLWCAVEWIQRAEARAGLRDVLGREKSTP